MMPLYARDKTCLFVEARSKIKYRQVEGDHHGISGIDHHNLNKIVYELLLLSAHRSLQTSCYLPVLVIVC